MSELLLGRAAGETHTSIGRQAPSLPAAPVLARRIVGACYACGYGA